MTISNFASTRSPGTATPEPAGQATTPPRAGPAAAAPTPPGLLLRRPAAEPARLADVKDFSKPLALAGDNYKALYECVLAVKEEASQCRSEWLASGSRTSLAAAQGLDIKDALLNGLYLIRLFHKEWSRSGPVVSPEKLARVLPLFRHALDLCENHSDAVQFPILGLDPALEYLQNQVSASWQSLETGQWQGTLEGRWHADRQDAQRSQNPDVPLSAPFADLKAACRDFGGVVERLRTALHDGPASRRMEAADRVAPQPPARPPRQAPQTPQAKNPAAAATPVQAWERSFKSVLCMNLPAPHRAAPAARPVEPPRSPLAGSTSLQPRPAAGQPPAPPLAGFVPQRAQAATSSLVTAIALEAPAAPAPEAAHRRQEQLAALEAALAPLQAEAARLCHIAPAGAPASAADDPPWARPSQCFVAWQAAVQAHDAWSEALAEHAGALLEAGSSDPAARRKQGQIDQACNHALAQAEQAAAETLAACSQACHDALALGNTHPAGPAIFDSLAAHCRGLHQQWLEAPVRPRLPGLEARMEQYTACEAACSVMAKGPDDAAEALYKAEQLRPATGRLVYAQLHRALLNRAVDLELDASYALQKESCMALRPAKKARAGASMTFDALLVGDPLPDERTGASDPSTDQAPAPATWPAEDLAFVQQAREIAEIAYERRERSIELPDDAPPQAIWTLQAAQAALHQVRLTAQSIAATLGSFHELAAAFGRNRPTEWPALARQRADALGQLGAEISQALQAQQKLARQLTRPWTRQWMEGCSEILINDRPVVARVQLSLETLGSLLALRVSANQVRRRIVDQDKLDLIDCPEFNGRAYLDVADTLRQGVCAIDKLLQDETIGFGGEDRKARHVENLNQNVSTLNCRIDCDRLLVRSKLLLAWAQKAREPGSGCLDTRLKLSASIDEVAEQAKALNQFNQDRIKGAASSAQGDSFAAQIGINRNVHRQLLQLLKALREDLKAMPSLPAAAGSRPLQQASPGTPAVRPGQLSRRPGS